MRLFKSVFDTNAAATSRGELVRSRPEILFVGV